MKRRRDDDGWPVRPVLTPDPAERHYPDEDASIRDIPADRYIDEWPRSLHPIWWVMAGVIGGLAGFGASVATALWWWS